MFGAIEQGIVVLITCGTNPNVEMYVLVLAVGAGIKNLKVFLQTLRKISLHCQRRVLRRTTISYRNIDFRMDWVFAVVGRYHPRVVVRCSVLTALKTAADGATTGRIIGSRPIPGN